LNVRAGRPSGDDVPSADFSPLRLARPKTCLACSHRLGLRRGSLRFSVILTWRRPPWPARNGNRMNELRHLLSELYNVRALIEWGGTLLCCVIVFVETGMFVGFFLPGDSLLVTAGVFAGAGQLKLSLLLTVVALCAVAGDQLGYFIGWRAGTSLYRREDSRFFKKRYLEEAHQFYEHYGGKTVILARFVPIIRTFCPPVAGAARMRYLRYFLFDIAGGILWVWSTVLLGYTLGRTVPNIEKRIHYVIAAVIVASLIPAAYHAWKRRQRNSRRDNPDGMSSKSVPLRASRRPQIESENEP
jgi:membrane-associated protein